MGTANAIILPMAEREYLTEREACLVLGKSLSSLRRWRWQRIGPPWVKNGAAVEYMRADIEAYRQRNRVVPRGAK